MWQRNLHAVLHEWGPISMSLQFWHETQGKIGQGKIGLIIGQCSLFLASKIVYDAEITVLTALSQQKIEISCNEKPNTNLGMCKIH